MARKLIIIFILLNIFSACAPRPAVKKEPIKIAINIWPGYAHAFIAQEKGFFKKNNVEVELVLEQEISDSSQRYKYGGVDGVFIPFADVIVYNDEGISTKTVYVTDFSDTGDVIIGRPEINSLAGLKGKIISFEGVNTFSHIFVLEALKQAGIKESEVYFENIPAQQVLGALEEKRIDVGHTWEPVKSAALRKGYKILAKAGNFKGVIANVLAFNTKVIKERPDDIKRIVKSLIEARDFIYSNRDEALEIMAKAEGMSEEAMDEGIKGVSLPDLGENIKFMSKDGESSLDKTIKIIVEFYLDHGQLSKVPDFEDIVDAGFVNELNSADEHR